MGNFNLMNGDEAFSVYERLAENSQQKSVRRREQVHEIGSSSAAGANSEMALQIANLTKAVSQLLESQNTPKVETCASCGGTDHKATSCSYGAGSNNMGYEEANYMGQFGQRPQGGNFQGGYNNNWRNFNAPPNQRQQGPPGFQPRPPYNPPPPAMQHPQPQQEKNSKLEDMLMQYLATQDAQIKKLNADLEQNKQLHQSSIRNLEMQIGHLNQALAERQTNQLPSNTEVNPKGKENVMAISLRSGKQLIEPMAKDKEKLIEETGDGDESNINKAKEEHDPSAVASGSGTTKTTDEETPILPPEVKPYVPPIPFPECLGKKKKKDDNSFKKFLELFRSLEVKLPFAEALAQMPSYAKFLKEIVSSKEKLKEYAMVSLTEECSAILQNKLPPKLKDPGSFSIPCSIGSITIDKCLCDLGASINLMPLSLFKKLKMGELKPTTVSLQLADRSLKYPIGIVEDIMVRVGKFVFPADFLVLEIEECLDVPIILGRPFLATGRAVIDVQDGKLTFRVGKEKQEFKVFTALKAPTYEDSCYLIHTVEQYTQSVVVKENSKVPREVHLSPSPKEKGRLLKILVDHKGISGEVTLDARSTQLNKAPQAHQNSNMTEGILMKLLKWLHEKWRTYNDYAKFHATSSANHFHPPSYDQPLEEITISNA